VLSDTIRVTLPPTVDLQRAQRVVRPMIRRWRALGPSSTVRNLERS
jgi:hypothetical protein